MSPYSHTEGYCSYETLTRLSRQNTTTNQNSAESSAESTRAASARNPKTTLLPRWIAPETSCRVSAFSSASEPPKRTMTTCTTRSSAKSTKRDTAKGTQKNGSGLHGIIHAGRAILAFIYTRGVEHA